MKTIVTNPVRRGQWLARFSIVCVIGFVFALISAPVSAAEGVSTEAGPEGPA
jgi:hypothetical protein